MTTPTFNVTNPANQEVIAQVKNMTPADALAAVQRAEAAYQVGELKLAKSERPS